MAEISTSSPLFYAALFGVSPKVIQEAGAVGLHVVASIGALSVVDQSGNKYGTVNVKGSALTLAKNGAMGPASKGVIQQQLEKALVAGINSLAGAGTLPEPVLDTSGMSPGQKAAYTKAMKKISLDDPVPLKPQVKMYNPSKSVTDEVPLSAATKLYEPVAGSTSVYHVFAMYPGLNIAMRRTHSKVSLRCEGANLPSKKAVLANLGFDDHGDYASVHFNVSEDALTKKTVGALIGLLGFGDAIAIGDPLKISIGA